MSKCEHCGADYEEVGILCEASVYAVWNKDHGRYEFRVEGRDFETKCPSCYAYSDETATLVKED